ncbi:hypothetical protein L7F22_059408 [Adiantum nelumboides]|nr:hypothetical protein [Adiantum nelumboides]
MKRELDELRALQEARTHVWCSNCNTAGHPIQDCPQRAYCTFCAKSGHDDKDCYYLKRLRQIQNNPGLSPSLQQSLIQSPTSLQLHAALPFHNNMSAPVAPTPTRGHKCGLNITGSNLGVPAASLIDYRSPRLTVSILGREFKGVIVDCGSGINLMPDFTLVALGLQISRSAPFTMTLADQRSVRPLINVEQVPLQVQDFVFKLDFVVVRLPQVPGGFPLLIGRPWLRHNKALHDWGKGEMWLTTPGQPRRAIQLEEGIDPNIQQSSFSGFNSATFNSSREILVLGSYNGFHVFQKTCSENVWEDWGRQEVENSYSISMVGWKPDGSQVAIGGFCGNVDLYDAYVKRQRYSDKFEFIYLSEGQVILTQLSPYTKMLLQSQFGWQIMRINIYMDQFLIAYTEETLLLGNLENCKLSESQCTLYIWYSIQNIGHATKFSLKGDLEGVRRVQGQTEVLVHEGFNTVSYELDEALIEIVLALEKFDLDQTFSALEPLELTVETKFLWKQLGVMCLQRGKLLSAQYCYSLLGNVCRSEYLKKVNKRMQVLPKGPEHNNRHLYSLQANLKVLSDDWKDPESILLEQGLTKDAIRMYTDAFRWKEALAISNLQNSVSNEMLSRNYLEWLFKTGQTEDAGKYLASSADLNCAISILLFGNLPGLAADYAVKLPNESRKEFLMDKISRALLTAGMLEKLGELMESLGDYERAQHAFRDTYSFRQAVQLAQINSAKDVIKLQEEWGDYLVSKYEMYSKAAMWEDAIRIARSCSGNSAINEVAYACAVHTNGKNGLEALTKQGLLNQAIDYAVDLGAFKNALQLCSAASADKLQEVQVKYARFLEDQGNFHESEDSFIKAGQPMEAIKMHMDQKDWKSAARVADLFQPSALTEILVSQAQFLIEDNELKRAEALFIQAKKPELAVSMYKSRNLWDYAIRVAQKFMPDGLIEIQCDFTSFLQSEGANAEILDDVFKEGLAAESSHDFHKAIDLYMQMDLKSLPDMEKLQKVWCKALELAKIHAKNRLPEVTHAVAKQLVRAGQHQEAAQLYLENDHYKEAAEVLMLGGHWERSRKVGESLGQEKLSEDIERLYKEHLFKAGEAGLLVGIGGVREALDIYSLNEDWDKVHELSASLGQEAQKECSARHVSHCLQNSKVLEAISVVSHYGLLNTLESFELSGQLASQLLFSYGDTRVSSVAMQEFRTFLYKHLQDTKGCSSPESQSAFEDLEAISIPLTYMVSRTLCQQQGLKELAAKHSVSLLRFVKSLPADLAFYDAGIACREVEWNDKAFVFFNRYLDIAEAIDDKETSIFVDHPAFSKSDIPQALIVPKGHFVDVNKQEEIQDWVIQYSVNQQEEKSTMTKECKICQASTFEASLCCFGCKAQSKACIVTGYPLNDDACTECPCCHWLANTCDWRTFLEVFHSCPWCNASMDASHLQQDRTKSPDI